MKPIESLVQDVMGRLHQKSAQQEKPSLLQLTRQVVDENQLDTTQIETLAPLVNKAYLQLTGSDPDELVVPSRVLAEGFAKAASYQEDYPFLEYSTELQERQTQEMVSKQAYEEPSTPYQNGSHGFNAAKSMKAALVDDIYALKQDLAISETTRQEKMASMVDTVKLLKMYGLDYTGVAQGMKSASADPVRSAIVLKLWGAIKQVKSASRASEEHLGELFASLSEACGDYVESHKQVKFASEALALKAKSNVLLSQIGEVLLK